MIQQPAKFSTTAVLLFSLFFLSACVRKGTDNTSQQQVFYLNLSSGALESLDPAYAKDLYTMWTTHMLYNTLVETNENLNTIPSIAKRWQINEDGTLYLFYLRTDVYFHDNPLFNGGKGRLLTAKDAAYSFSRLLNSSVASPGAWIFNDRVTGQNPFTALNDTTLQIKLKAPFRPLLQLLTMPYCSIVPQEVAEHWGKDFRRHPCGTGPFQYHDWDEGNALTLHRNPRYWEQDGSGHPLPYLGAVQLSFYDSKATEFFLFLQGKLDFVNGVDGSFKDLVLSKNGQLKPDFAAKYNLSKSTYLNTEYIGILQDVANPVAKGTATQNKLIRQAINYAIDRPRIARYFRNGIGIPATNGFIPPGLHGSDSSGSYGYHYNPAKARSLLAQAGYPNGKGLPVTTILTPDAWADILNFIATQLQDAGIPTRIETIQPNILKQQMSEKIGRAHV